MTGLYLLDYGAGNVQSLANSLLSQGHTFRWIKDPADFDNADILIFPGVGAFETAIAALHARGLFEPLRQYILSGRPYFGICIGMQVLFQSSKEGTSTGLGIIPCPIDRFSDADKAVPHMGWNAAIPIPTSTSTSTPSPANTISSSPYYYFVHSYCAKYAPDVYPDAMRWTHTTTQYGRELFVSSVRKGNVYATQFHPEKSGKEGLLLIDTWLRLPRDTLTHAPEAPLVDIKPRDKHQLTKRIVACMDVRANDAGDLVVTKGDQYDVREKSSSTPTTTTTTTTTTIDRLTTTAGGGEVRNLGKPVSLAARYFADGADELCLLNITSFRHSPLHDQPMLSVVRAASATLFVPLTIGGGIKDTIDPDGTPRPALEVAAAYFRAGADKVSIGSDAVCAVEKLRARGYERDGGTAIEQIAEVYGKQAVVVSIDPKKAYVEDPATYTGPGKEELIRGAEDGDEEDRGKTWWYQCTVSGGREKRDIGVAELARGVEILGAGEILVNSIDRDGTGKGFDLNLVNLVKRSVRIPVVASSGAGSAAHFADVFEETGVEAALAAGIFHRGEVGIGEVKRVLGKRGINVRL